jgi:hypothetical protein
LLGWIELGPAHRDTGGLHVGDLWINPLEQHNLTGAVFYRPEEILINAPDPSTPAGLQVRAQILEVVPSRPLARVLLRTNPPITALMLHRDLHRLPPPCGTDVEVTLPQHAIRVQTKS